MKVIMISGRAGAGKSTFTKFCMEYLSSKNQISTLVPFARGVKSTAKESFGWDGEKDDAGRRLLQGIGLLGRAYNENLWAEQAIHKIDMTFVIGSDTIFIDDWRFPNEGKVVSEKYDACKIRINRPEEYLPLFGTPLYSDVSETSLPDYDEGIYDFVVTNDDGLDELRVLAESIIKSIFSEEETNV
ncbi:hypothetical protein LCGC14_0996030 [marine sediment metagenome]|uniref:NadR/Ttd14 AAA domain-containing protein n=1 Tax=marine sediment metagenome TaxID=412755 RepID=A0A0F9QMV9_9ZZZZ